MRRLAPTSAGFSESMTVTTTSASRAERGAGRPVRSATTTASAGEVMADPPTIRLRHRHRAALPVPAGFDESEQAVHGAP